MPMELRQIEKVLLNFDSMGKCLGKSNIQSLKSGRNNKTQYGRWIDVTNTVVIAKNYIQLCYCTRKKEIEKEIQINERNKY